MSGDTSTFPVFKLRLVDYRKTLWTYGRTHEGRQALSKALGPFDKFFVVDRASEEHVAGLKKTAEESVEVNNHRSVLHAIAALKGRSTKDAVSQTSSVTVLQQVLRLGVDPDLFIDKRHGSASEACVRYGNVDAAQVLVLCRPKLRFKKCNSSSVNLEKLAIGRSKEALLRASSQRKAREYQNVAEIWGKALKDGFPTIAQLACEKKWYAVQNLCRRRAVPDEEKNAKFAGKSAIEWALVYKEDELAEELRYLLQKSPDAPHGSLEKTLRKADAQVQTDLPAAEDKTHCALKRKLELQEEEMKNKDKENAAIKMKLDWMEAEVKRKDEWILRCRTSLQEQLSAVPLSIQSTIAAVSSTRINSP